MRGVCGRNRALRELLRYRKVLHAAGSAARRRLMTWQRFEGDKTALRALLRARKGAERASVVLRTLAAAAAAP